MSYLVSEAAAERAIAVLKRAIEAAENSNQAGEDFVVAAAAAPELLEALQTAMQWIKAWDVGFLFDEEWPSDEAKINAAIARATGAA